MHNIHIMSLNAIGHDKTYTNIILRKILSEVSILE